MHSFLFVFLYLVKPEYDKRNMYDKLSEFSQARIGSGKTGFPPVQHKCLPMLSSCQFINSAY